MSAQRSSRPATERILSVVLALLESGGTDAVQLADVAGRARVSMTTIYKYFGSRDELILAAVELWMDQHVYRSIAEIPDGLPLREGLLRQFRQIFGAWESQPRMAESFMRARLAPGGERLELQGMAAVEPFTRALFKDVDAELAEDLMMIIANVNVAMVVRFAAGDVPVTEIRRVVERTILRLTDSTAGSSVVRSRQSRPRTTRANR
jgi:AcrR family transcriptional regulator